ncbi:MAG: transglutaminase [Sandaracinus sp.]|nr:transglutaminase [Sandaracinus sp.]
MKLEVKHVTTYVYEDVVSVGQSEAKLRPRATRNQEVWLSEVTIEPTPSVQGSHRDYFGNHTDYFLLDRPHAELRVTAVSRVNVHPPRLPEPAQTAPWERARQKLRETITVGPEGAMEHVFPSPFAAPAPELKAYAEKSFTPGRPLLEAAFDLRHRIFDEFDYVSGSTTIATPLATVMRTRKGVCQDFAHLMIAMLRSLGLASRYVSGYLVTQPPPGQVKLQGADASHAWLAVWCPGVGFVDLDPTNDTVPDASYVTTAWGRDFGDVSPIKGVVLGGGPHTVHAAVDVTPIDPQ